MNRRAHEKTLRRMFRSISWPKRGDARDLAADSANGAQRLQQARRRARVRRGGA